MNVLLIAQTVEPKTVHFFKHRVVKAEKHFQTVNQTILLLECDNFVQFLSTQQSLTN